MDADQPADDPLRDLLEILAQEIEEIGRSLEQAYEDAFVATADWLRTDVGYILRKDGCSVTIEVPDCLLDPTERSDR